MSEADVEALWLPLGSAMLLIILLITWLWKGSKLVPELSTKAVLITGCDSGFGHELAKRLDSLGVTVFAGCLFPEDVGAKELKLACSNRLHVLHLDVTREEHVRNVVKYVNISLGNNKTLWAVVNNAGVLKTGFMEFMDKDIAKNMFEVNAIGPLTVTNAFLPLLRISHGRVVIVSSLSGRLVTPGMGLYCMSKHAATALANVLRFELKQWGITVHDIQPGFFRTNLTNVEFLTKDMESRWIQLPEEVRAVYGQNYFEKCKTQFSDLLESYFVSKKTYQVVDDLQDAVVGKSPKSVYYPGLKSKLYLCLVYLGPIHRLIVWILFPLPKKNGDAKTKIR